MSKTESAAKRVLVAEDETLIRLDIVETLTAAGYDVVGEAADGQEAIDLAVELEPDVCVLDVKMPKVEGITAAEEILKEIPTAIVMLTAFSQKELVQRAAEVGAMAYVTKPFGPSDLIPAVEIALSRKAQIDALDFDLSLGDDAFGAAIDAPAAIEFTAAAPDLSLDAPVQALDQAANAGESWDPFGGEVEVVELDASAAASGVNAPVPPVDAAIRRSS